MIEDADWAPSPAFERRIGRIEARTAVLEAMWERMVADVHEVKEDVKSGNRMTNTNLFATVLAAVAVIGTLIVRH